MMRFNRISRRRLLSLVLCGTPVLAVADALWLEPRWVIVRRVRLAKGKPVHRLVHFTDVHHKGDKAYLQSVIAKINALAPDFVCFTGDIVEEKRFLGEALECFRAIKSPLYGVPGNHDYWSQADFNVIGAAFASTGGRWLMDKGIRTPGGEVHVIGVTCSSHMQPRLPIDRSAKNILLMHYPDWVEKLGEQKLDLILAGHSHGGQVLIPFYGPVIHTFGAERHNAGLFQTPSGPLYVNPGIGWFLWPVRFCCRPEITVIEI